MSAGLWNVKPAFHIYSVVFIKKKYALHAGALSFPILSVDFDLSFQVIETKDRTNTMILCITP